MFDSLKRRLQAVLTPAQLHGLTGYMSTPFIDAGVPITPETALGVSAAKRGVELIAGTLASASLILYRERSEGRHHWLEEAREDPRYQVFRWSPASDADSVQFFETLITQALVYGRSLAFKGRRRVNGSVVPDLRILDSPAKITIERDSSDPLAPPVWKSGEKRVDPTQYFELRWTSLDGAKAIGLAEFAAQSLSLAAAAQNAFAAFLSSGMMQGGIISPEAVLSEPNYTRLRDAFESGSGRDSPGGWRKAGGIFIPPFPLRILPFSVNAKDSELLPARRFQVADIGRFLGVPVFMLTDEVAVVRANAQVGETGFLKYTIRPWAERVETAIKRQLLSDPADADLVVKFDLDELARGDRRAELEGDRLELETGQATPNELRTRRRRRPASEPDADRIHIATNNLSPIGSTQEDDNSGESA